MSENNVSIQAASARDISEVLRLFNAYRDFYGEAPDEARALTFIHDRITLACAQPPGQFSEAQYFLAWMQTPQGRRAVGLMHLMPSANALAMRPIWFLEDLYVEPFARRQGIATTFLRHAEQFARSTGAERLRPHMITRLRKASTESSATSAKSTFGYFIACSVRRHACALASKSSEKLKPGTKMREE